MLFLCYSLLINGEKLCPTFKSNRFLERISVPTHIIK